MSMIYLSQLGMISPLGNSLDATKRALLELARSGVVLSDDYSPGRPLPLGRIDGNLPLPPVDEWPLPDRSRNNQVALAALQQIRPAVDSAIERFGGARVGVVIGTSTSG
ncbi:MAG: beta-ketoacyl-[acyl-carrier-protein] synthase II, partial [Candidatus Binatia bacterium]